jgi:hypothetical protein
MLTMRVPSLLLLFSLISSSTVRPQAPDTLWTRTYGGSNIDVGHAVEAVPGGGFIITGYTRSFGTMSGRNVLLIRTTSAGDTLWIRAYGGNADDEGAAVAPTNDGGFMITGYTKSFGAGLKDVYLIRTDSSGNTIWSTVFGGPADDEAYGVALTPDGGCILAGATSSYGAGSRDGWLIRVSATGNERWRRTLGGLSSDGARGVRQTSDGGFIVTGWTFSYGPSAVGNAWLVRTDTAGNQIWQMPFGGSDVDRGHAVQQTADGGFIITGYTASTGAGLDDMWLIKTDNAGNEQWNRTYGGSGRDYGQAVSQTADGGFIVAGYTLSFGAGGEDVWLVKTDAQGNQSWSRTAGGSASDVAYGIQELAEGGYIVTGHTLSRGAGVHDVWLLRFSAPTGAAAEDEAIPTTLSLAQNYPNPFNPVTVIRYAIPSLAPAGTLPATRTAGGHATSLQVFDLLGRRVATLVDTWMPPGVHSATLDGTWLAGGVYFYRLSTTDRTLVRRMLLLK